MQSRDQKRADAAPNEHRHTLIEAVDCLVEPLDEILILMRSHARAQRLVLAAIALVATVAVITVVYALRLTSKIEDVERRLDDMAKTSADAQHKAASVEKKIDNVEKSVEEGSRLRVLVESLASASAHRDAPKPPVILRGE